MLDFDGMSKEELVGICNKFRAYIEYNLSRTDDKDELAEKMRTDRDTGMSYAKIGSKYNLSRQRVFQILNK